MISDRKVGAPGQSTQQLSYEKLKGFAAFVLEHKMDEAASLSLQISRASQIPLLNLFAHLTEEQLLEMVKKDLADFFEQLTKGEALQEAKNAVSRWKEGKTEGIGRDAVQISDFILGYSGRRQTILQLLPEYTSDCHLIVAIMKELETFYQALEQFALSIYMAIQQEQLYEQNNFLSSIIINSADGILAYDRQLRITEWNPALENSLGKAKNELLGKTITDVFPAIENAPIMLAFKSSLKGNKVHLPNSTYISRSGGYEAHVSPLFDEASKITGGVALVHDITHRIEAEENLKEHQEELQAANEELTEQREELQAANEELTEQRQEVEAINEELQESLAQLEEAKEQLQRLVSQFEEAQAIAHLGSFEYLIKSNQVVWSEEMKRIFGLEPTHPPLTFKEYLQFIFEEDLPLVESVVEEALASGEAYTFEHRVLRPNGEVRWVHSNGKAIFNKGKAVKLQGTAMDITDRKVAELEIKEKQFFIQKVMNTTPDIITVFDLEKKTNIYGNRELSEILGYSKEEIAELRQQPDLVQSLVHPEDVKRGFEFLMEFKNHTGDQAREIEYRLCQKSKEHLWVTARYNVFKRNKKGEAVQIIGVTRNINDRKLAEEKLKLTNYTLHETNEELVRTEELLKEANNELEDQVMRRTAELQSKNEQLIRINADLDNFIYTASHDLKAPIANLEGLLVLLHKKLLENLSEKDQQLLGMMQASIERLKKTILDLSDVTKVQKELEEEERENICLQEIIDDVQQDVAALIREHKAAVHVDLQVKEVAFDRKNMRSILYNLLTNAIKYRSAHRSPVVYITTEPSTEGLLLSVRDNGEGIPEKQHSKIFSLFKRLNKSVDGSGMGLYIVKKIIDNNGGKIDVESQVGEGTTFKIYLENGTETD